MTVLYALSYGATVIAFAFVVLSLASGLLWLSELIEENSRYSKVIGQRGIYVIIFVHALLYFFDSLPLPQTIFSILCHVVYLQNFSHTWPIIYLTSVSFIASCCMVIIDHFLWFFYFAHLTQEARQRSQRMYRGPRPPQNAPGFAEIATFFGLCVWLAPLFLFLSLSANDNALPTFTGEPPTPSTPSKLTIPTTQQHTSLFKSIFKSLPLDTIPRIRPKRRETEGLIAPQSPTTRSAPSSPLLSSPHTSSLNNIPVSPLISPRFPRTPSGTSFGMGDDVFEEPSLIGSGSRNTPSSFTLSPPPRRSASAYVPASPVQNRRVGLGLRRTVSGKESGDGL
ncbi:hypothetical protein JAAARDRAFT_187691 [Jaapia argillacea MUCL 33604]|uniref:DUF396-domain-containing protein n=1 Tax=Jaapia argillacea MUCL 33604 TaxID=933084 RepID=A0A067QLE8_9AGAM|nr:hypothetical protein JAAARDRAFT_187691 [Jaapia argillacea MUCL 33604]